MDQNSNAGTPGDRDETSGLGTSPQGDGHPGDAPPVGDPPSSDESGTIGDAEAPSTPGEPDKD